MIADDLRLAGAVMTRRNGRPVPVHYGSVSAELSVCRKHVGIAERADLDALELSGDPDGFLGELGALLGCARPRSVARPHRRRDLRRDRPARAIVVGTPAACRPFAVRRSPLRCIDRSGACEVFTLVGPRTRALLAGAGLPVDLVEHGVRACWAGGGPAVLLHEADGRHLLVVAADSLRSRRQPGRAPRCRRSEFERSTGGRQVVPDAAGVCRRHDEQVAPVCLVQEDGRAAARPACPDPVLDEVDGQARACQQRARPRPTSVKTSHARSDRCTAAGTAARERPARRPACRPRSRVRVDHAAGRAADAVARPNEGAAHPSSAPSSRGTRRGRRSASSASRSARSAMPTCLRQTDSSALTDP